MIRARPVQGDVLSVLYENPALPPKLRDKVLRKYRAHVWPEWIARSMIDVVGQIHVDCFVAELDRMTEPARLQAALRKVNAKLDDSARLRAYARLALMAGPEPVWALELARAGDVGSMMPVVRDSMAGGGVEPFAGSE